MRSSSLSFLSLALVFLSSFHAGLAKHHKLMPRHAGRSVPKIAAAWYGGWTTNSTPSVPISKISWDKYTHLIYAFAETTPDVAQLDLSGSNPGLLPIFVDEAHKHGVKASVTIGGWGGSRYWSSNVGSAPNRTTFVNTVTAFALKYNLDGLDFDWEYPGKQGIGCNAVTPNDSANFLAFIEELRKHPVGAKLILSAAVSIVPFTDATGVPSSDVTQFARVLDYIAIMNYDVFGSWSSVVGPNSPLDDTCAPAAYQQGSAVSAVKAWNLAGFPLSKIVLGVAGYGHSFSVKPSDPFNGTALAAYPPFNKSIHPQGDSWTSGPGIDECGNAVLAGDTVDFWGMVSEGYLKPNGKVRKHIAYRFDKCSQTASVYNKTSEIMVSFDDAKAFSAKGDFIRSSGLGGFSMWQVGSDYNDILLDAIRGAATC